VEEVLGLVIIATLDLCLNPPARLLVPADFTCDQWTTPQH